MRRGRSGVRLCAQERLAILLAMIYHIEGIVVETIRWSVHWEIEADSLADATASAASMIAVPSDRRELTRQTIVETVRESIK